MAHQARKRFGQHFLNDASIIRAIVGAIRPTPYDRIIEIGPGLGALTLILLENTPQLDVVELDRDLVSFWEKKQIAGLTIHQADALQFNFLEWAHIARLGFSSEVTGGVKVIGNLPYNISSPLLFHLLDAIEGIDEQVFMLQKEVVERMVAQPGDSEYSRLSVMLQMKYHMENCFEVPPECFDPPPRVDSAVVSMLPRKDLQIPLEIWRILEKLVAKAFSQRRKVLANNLGDYKEVLELSPDILRARAQEISGETYLQWAYRLSTFDLSKLKLGEA